MPSVSLTAAELKESRSERSGHFRIQDQLGPIGIQPGTEPTPSNYKENEFFAPENYGALAKVKMGAADFASNLNVPEQVRKEFGISNEDVDKAIRVQTTIKGLVGEIRKIVKDSGNMSSGDQAYA